MGMRKSESDALLPLLLEVCKRAPVCPNYTELPKDPEVSLGADPKKLYPYCRQSGLHLDYVVRVLAWDGIGEKRTWEFEPEICIYRNDSTESA